MAKHISLERAKKEFNKAVKIYTDYWSSEYSGPAIHKAEHIMEKAKTHYYKKIMEADSMTKNAEINCPYCYHGTSNCCVIEQVCQGFTRKEENINA